MNYIYTNDKSVKDLALRAFPGYTGKKFKVNVTENHVNMESYWSGGSKSTFRVFNLVTNEMVTVPENGTMFTPQNNFTNTVFPCQGIAVIEHSIFCGKDMGITIHIHPANMNNLAITNNENKLNYSQWVVLVATRSYKSQYRLQEARRMSGITCQDYDKAKNELINMKLLNSNGSITNEGRNMVGNKDLYCVVRELAEGKITH